MSDESISDKDYRAIRRMAADSLRVRDYRLEGAASVVKDVKFEISSRLKAAAEEERHRVRQAVAVG